MDKLLLVNKDNRLSFNYVPSDLVIVPDEIKIEKLSLCVLRDYLKFRTYSQKNELNIFVDSGYRSYYNQLKIYIYYMLLLGIKNGSKRVAFPGTSEHQTGLAFDLGVIENGIARNMNSDEAKWLDENAYKYGFILRYPKNKENVTGYDYEPWHFRYVGSDISSYMYENNLTLEELHKNKTMYLSR